MAYIFWIALATVLTTFLYIMASFSEVFSMGTPDTLKSGVSGLANAGDAIKEKVGSKTLIVVGVVVVVFIIIFFIWKHLYEKSIKDSPFLVKDLYKGKRYRDTKYKELGMGKFLKNKAIDLGLAKGEKESVYKYVPRDKVDEGIALDNVVNEGIEYTLCMWLKLENEPDRHQIKSSGGSTETAGLTADGICDLDALNELEEGFAGDDLDHQCNRDNDCSSDEVCQPNTTGERHCIKIRQMPEVLANDLFIDCSKLETEEDCTKPRTVDQRCEWVNNKCRVIGEDDKTCDEKTEESNVTDNGQESETQEEPAQTELAPQFILNKDYSPCIQYISQENTLRIYIRCQKGEMKYYDLKDVVPLQKWNHLAILLDGRNLDIYLNGRMIKSFILPSVPILNSSRFKLFPEGGAYAQVSYLRYFNRALGPHRIKYMYFRNFIADTPKPEFLWWLI
jgi:hypothetical protein